MQLISDDISQWCDSLAGFEPEYKAVHCTTVLQFFALGGRKTIISKNNLIPIPDIHYTIHSKSENRFYFKTYRGFSVDEIYYLRPSLTFSPPDDEVSALRGFVGDGNVWLLFTPEGVTQMSVMLERLYKANLSGDGKLPYKSWIKIMELSLKMEDYKEFYLNGTGFKTQMKVWTDELADIWRQVSLKK